MPSVTKLAIIAARYLEGKLSARPEGTGTSEIPVTLYEMRLLHNTIFLEKLMEEIKYDKKNREIKRSFSARS